jgi:hypothetical protein
MVSCQVEGAEALVLSGLDMQQYVFLAMTVERPTEAVHMLLVSNGYHWVTRLAMFGECLYIHKSHKQFGDIMSRYKAMRSSLLGTQWKSGHRQPLFMHKYMMKTQEGGPGLAS